MSTGAISVLNGRLPDTNTTEPYSPKPRANESVKPVVSAGTRATAALALRKPAAPIDVGARRAEFFALMAGAWQPAQGSA